MPAIDAVHHLNAALSGSRLSGRQRLFCNRIAGGASGAEAARQAGYSAAAASQQAWRLLQNPQVQAEIERVKAAPELRQQAELDRLLAKVEGVFAKAVRDGQCAPALRAVQMEARLRERGAQSLPEDVLPAELVDEEQGNGSQSPKLGISR